MISLRLQTHEGLSVLPSTGKTARVLRREVRMDSIEAASKRVVFRLNVSCFFAQSGELVFNAVLILGREMGLRTPYHAY